MNINFGSLFLIYGQGLHNKNRAGSNGLALLVTIKLLTPLINTYPSNIMAIL